MTETPTSAAPESVAVDAPCGPVLGRSSGSVHSFLGIPYAMAPVEERRFAPPVAPEPFPEPFEAFAYGSIPPQDIDPMIAVWPPIEDLFYPPGVSPEEDCLNLNVWAPEGAEAAPVVVYIHGGGFLGGSGSAPWFDGTTHAREHGLVVVTLNYRLGILGGLYLGDYAPERCNLGLQDQILALRWVRENIGAFGGDPGRVTVAGQSAGAMSASALLFAPAAERLFARAVVESGNHSMSLGVEEARTATRRVLDRLQIPHDAPDVLDRLQGTSLLRILAVQRGLGIAGRLSPTVDDGHVLVGNSGSALPEWTRDMDLLIGSTTEENRLFSVIGWASEPASIEDAVSRLVADPADQAAALALYGSAPESPDEIADLAYLMSTDQTWTAPVREMALAHAAFPARTYHYAFAWRSGAVDGRLGAAHAVDLPFFWGNFDAPGVAELLGPRVDELPTQTMAKRVSASLAQFVATGDLSECPLGEWPTFLGDRRATMVIDVQPDVELDRHAARLDFWRDHPGSLTGSMDTAGDAGA